MYTTKETQGNNSKQVINVKKSTNSISCKNYPEVVTVIGFKNKPTILTTLILALVYLPPHESGSTESKYFVTVKHKLFFSFYFIFESPSITLS